MFELNRIFFCFSFAYWEEIKHTRTKYYYQCEPKCKVWFKFRKIEMWVLWPYSFDPMFWAEIQQDLDITILSSYKVFYWENMNKMQ